MSDRHATTVLAVLRDGHGALASDGQITLGQTIVKRSAVKVRTLHDGRVLAGFAGGVADALTLFEHFEGHLERYRGNLQRAAVELARQWRSDRVLRRLEAMLLVMDCDAVYTISGQGDVIEGEEGIAAVGSGAPYALAGARALKRHTELPAVEICRGAMDLAAEICIYTNDRVSLLELAPEGDPA